MTLSIPRTRGSRTRLQAVYLLAVPIAALWIGGVMSCATDADPYLWLEEVEGQVPLAWAVEQSRATSAELEAQPGFRELEARLLAILDSPSRIPGVVKRGEYLYNFWRDAAHPRGLWRRATLAEYRKPEPAWDVLLDLDALAREEGENWVWAGSDCLWPEHERCLISLSRGGGDAEVVREFDVKARAFVAGGFALPEAKHGVAWRDRDTLFLGTDFGPGSLTTSGYPRIVKEWKRGTPLAAAELVFEGKTSDVSVGAGHDPTPGFERSFVYRGPTFFTSELYLRRAGTLVRIEKPDDAEPIVHREWLFLRLRSPWTLGARTYPAGALLAARLEPWLAGERDVDVVYEPGERRSLRDFSPTRTRFLLNELDNVRSRIFALTPGPAGWQREPLAQLPELGSASAQAAEPRESDEYFLTVTDFLTPTSVSFGTVGSEPEKLKQLPSLFSAEGLRATQHETVSADGTRIPYFEIGPATPAPEGGRPTLLYGYGGFEVSMLPSYMALVGKAWLERGGVYVLANIRGGGEFGPSWHTSAIQANRPRAYEDFAAVAEDLVRRGVTRPAHLGIMGGSNGGLLVGNMLTRRPELFGAVVCEVPLLDMQRYHKLLAGASWMEEYGNPDDPAQWSFMRGFSPYHNVRAGVRYPRVLFMTSTRDDRVHPGHARKMVARMKAQGHDVLYYENTEGGHGMAANNAQSARMEALAFTFLWKQLQ
jgi:prolyl oligopeptidase